MASLHGSLTFAPEFQWIDHSSIMDGNISICKVINQGANSQELTIVLLHTHWWLKQIIH